MIHFATLSQILNNRYPNLEITSECEFDGYIFTCEYTGKHQDQTRFTLVYRTPVKNAICTFTLSIYDKNGIQIEGRYESCKSEDSQKVITKLLPKNIK
jgi:hypothetical protein